MRHRALATALAAAITAGCATGPINAPPRVKHPSEAASVTIERQWSIVGAPATMFFIINDQRIYALLNGQRWSFQIDPDEYQFGYDLGFNSCRQRVILKPNTRYLLELTPICEIEPRRL
jgi:hypothetical protein